MKALSVRQPWASHIIYGGKDIGGKDIENRSWSTNYRGPLAIHAGQRVDQTTPPVDRPTPRGALIGVVDLVDVVRDHPSRWGERGQWHWVLANPRALPRPISYTGRLGLFELNAATSLEIERGRGDGMSNGSQSSFGVGALQPLRGRSTPKGAQHCICWLE